MERNLVPILLQYVMSYVGTAAMMVCGIGLLKAQIWARLLYTIWRK